MANYENRDGVIWIVEPEGEWELGPLPESISQFETTEQKLTQLKEQNLILMDALATVFEEVLALREIVEGGMVE